MIAVQRYADLVDRVGEDLGSSSWLTIHQDLINRFAHVTGDHMWVHVDKERAAMELPDGSTIAHGLLTFSLIPKLSHEIIDVSDPGMTFSYGANRLRYVHPVKPGDRIRLHAKLIAADTDRAESPDRIYLTFEYRVEIEGQDRPALVAEQVLLTHL
jgi:acyl dehydratase